ncbi:hypothetical protein D3C78_1695880 [compost metagenome]
MCCRQETIAAFPDIQPFVVQMIEEQFDVAKGDEAEQRAVIDHINRNASFLEERVQLLYQIIRIAIQLLV